jgi:predicted short-subunit dehydrogenase-like oxidoreductase (DUF2520 family)
LLLTTLVLLVFFVPLVLLVGSSQIWLQKRVPGFKGARVQGHDLLGFHLTPRSLGPSNPNKPIKQIEQIKHFQAKFMKPSIAIIGCGKVGTSLAFFLSKAGYRISGLFSKTRASAEAISQLINGPEPAESSWAAAKPADIVLITTPDDVISGACRLLADNDGFKENAAVLHCSGALPSTILSSAKISGTSTGSMHPLQSFATARTDINPFLGINMAVEGDRQAVDSAARIARDLGSQAHTIKTEGKTLYHAAAVVASNYLVTILDLSLKMLKTAGINKADGFTILKPLIDGTLNNIENVGIPEALTGPIARGDVDTVAAHLEHIADQIPELKSLYCKLGADTTGIALAKGSIDTNQVADFLKLLKQ